MTWPNYVLIHLLNEYIDSASFASFGSWFQSIAPLYLNFFLETLSSIYEVSDL